MTAPVPQYMRDLAAQMTMSARSLGFAAARHRTPSVLDVLALITTDGRTDLAGLTAQVQEVLRSGAPATTTPIDLRALIRTARAATALATTIEELADAADMFQAVRVLRRADNTPVPAYTDRLDAQVNLAVGRVDYVADIVAGLDVDDDVRWTLETELLNPVTGRAPTTYEAWLDGFNQVFAPAGLTPITLAEGDGTAFDRITTHGSSGTDGPLVSVVVSVFKPDQSLFTALGSLAAQTWANLEVLVVDDCSPEEFWPLIDAAVALDDRFRLHRMPVNGGTYAIRNWALREARGEFLGFQDSDDWTHPERIERQVRPMLDDPALVATLSTCVSVDGRLSLNHVGRDPIRTNSSSLLIRRDPVVAALGRFDAVRKGADSEFNRRLQLVFGDDRVRVLDEPLAIVQLTTGSLSRDEIADGWHDGNRVAYRDAFRHWHARIAAGESSPFLGASAVRPFPAPPAFLGRKGERRCDVLMVSDWRPGYVRDESAAGEILALKRAGWSTVMIRSEPMRYASSGRKAPTPPLMDLRTRGVASVGRWEEAITAAVAVIRDPEVLSYPPRADRVQLRARRVVVHAPFPPGAPGGDAVVYDPAVVESNARMLLGGDVAWQPASAAIAEALVAAGAEAEVLVPRVPGVVELPGRPRVGRRRRGRLVVGTTGLDPRRADRPTWEGLHAHLPDDDRFDVRIRDLAGTVDTVRRKRPLPPGWLLVADGTVESFLGGLDVFVGLPTRAWGPAPSHTCLQALALGCVLVVDPAYASIYGDAALYLDRPVETLLAALADDEARLVEQQQRGYAFVGRELSAQAFIAGIAPLIRQPQEEPA